MFVSLSTHKVPVDTAMVFPYVLVPELYQYTLLSNGIAISKSPRISEASSGGWL